jgi:hypothetical protein
VASSSSRSRYTARAPPLSMTALSHAPGPLGAAASLQHLALGEHRVVDLSESDEAMRAIETAPARKRHPTVVLAALHDLALTARLL